MARPLDEEFQKTLSYLNPEQLQAVQTIDGPVMVVAGPGTGKTHVLTMRIANILLQTDAQPSNILGLTYTDSAAQNMRRRLLKLIGPAAYQVRLQTFHAFADEVMQLHPDLFSSAETGQPVTELAKYQFLVEFLQANNFVYFRHSSAPFNRYRQIIDWISQLKRENIDAEKLTKLLEAEHSLFEQEKDALKKTELQKRVERLGKLQELSQIFQAYQEWLIDRHRYDFDDMIVMVGTALSTNEMLRAEYQEQLQYLLVDEYQDTNHGQQLILNMLSSFWGDEANVFVVGDPHQSIFRFQGASLETSLQFFQRFQNATLITLKTGYRCTQRVYDSAHAVIEHNLEQLQGKAVPQLLQALSQPLEGVHGEGSQITVGPATSVDGEAIMVAESVQSLIQGGTSLSQIAILFARRQDVIQVQHALEKWGVPFLMEGTDQIFDVPELVQFLEFLKTLLELRKGNESELLFRVLNLPWMGQDRLLIMKLSRAAHRSRMSLGDRVIEGYAAFSKLQDGAQTTELEFAIVEDVLHKMTQWQQQEQTMPFSHWLEKVAYETGFIEWLKRQPHRFTLLQYWRGFFNWIEQLNRENKTLHLESFWQQLQTMQAYNLGVPIQRLPAHDQAVTLCTVHKAKGQEWEHVFLVGCSEASWGQKKQGGLPFPDGVVLRQTAEEELSERRRLFYVALTRSSQHCTITFPESITNGNQLKPQIPSRFIQEIPKEHLLYQGLSTDQGKVEQWLEKLVMPAPAVEWSKQEKAWVEKQLDSFVLSPSALNTYLRSPEEFFWQYILRVPSMTSPQAALGTAVHLALEKYYSCLQKNEPAPSIQQLTDLMNDSLVKEPLDPFEQKNLLRDGAQYLQNYIENTEVSAENIFATEYSLGYGAHAVVIDDIPLSGKIDRIDWIDKVTKTFRVTDYKTSADKSINQILGLVGIENLSERELTLPESIRGPLKRQLLFYKILLESDRNFKGSVEQGVLVFLKTKKGEKLKDRQVPLSEDDVEELRQLIKQVMAEIRSLTFLSANS